MIDNVADAGAPSTAPTAFDNDSATVSVLSMAASSVIETVNVRTPVSPAPQERAVATAVVAAAGRAVGRVVLHARGTVGRALR